MCLILVEAHSFNDNQALVTDLEHVIWEASQPSQLINIIYSKCLSGLGCIQDVCF